MPTVFQAPVNKKQSAMKPLSSYAMNPNGIRFETQQEDEEVVLFLRQHPVVNVPWIIIAIFLFIAPTVVIPFVLRFFPFAIPLPGSYAVIGAAFWYLATFGYILGNFLYWFFNIYIVTNKRIVDIDFKYLLFKEFTEADLSKIQDLSYRTGGILATVFNYGTVLIQTAAEFENLEFEAVPKPEGIVQTIRKLSENTKGGHV